MLRYVSLSSSSHIFYLPYLLLHHWLRRPIATYCVYPLCSDWSWWISGSGKGQCVYWWWFVYVHTVCCQSLGIHVYDHHTRIYTIRVFSFLFGRFTDRLVTPGGIVYTERILSSTPSESSLTWSVRIFLCGKGQQVAFLYWNQTPLNLNHIGVSRSEFDFHMD